MPKITAIVVGTGGMARLHIRTMIQQKRTTQIVGFVEVIEASRDATRAVCEEAGCACPPFFDTVNELVRNVGSVDASFVCTPHKFHYENTRDCLKAGMHVLLEKPMVMNAREARRLIKVRDASGRHLVVAFPGSLSPALRKAKQMLTSGRIGEVRAIAAHVHQSWKRNTTGKWRQVPEISGGGFLFDTGSHMVNTVVELLGEDVKEVNALFDNCGTPVEIMSTVNGRSASGVMFAMVGAGDSIHCTSDVTVFGDEGVLRTGIWGERLEIKLLKDGEYRTVPCRSSSGVWQEFVRVLQGKQENPGPAEIGLRFALLMDMMRKSAAEGRPIRAR